MMLKLATIDIHDRVRRIPKLTLLQSVTKIAEIHTTGELRRDACRSSLRR